MEKVHVNLCLGLPGIIVYKVNSEYFLISTMHHKFTETHKGTMRNKLSAAPAMFSWNITLVPFRKFFPMIKTSSPPLIEQLWRLFFRISGSPAGWAEEWRARMKIHSKGFTGLRPSSLVVVLNVIKTKHHIKNISHHFGPEGPVIAECSVVSLFVNVFTHCRGWVMRRPVKWALIRQVGGCLLWRPTWHVYSFSWILPHQYGLQHLHYATLKFLHSLPCRNNTGRGNKHSILP